MKRIVSSINTQSPEFKANYAHNKKLAEELKQKHQASRHDRPQRDMDRLERQNKMFVRDRLKKLLDPGTPFLELSTLAANQAYDGDAPGAGVVAGIGIVSGR